MIRLMLNHKMDISIYPPIGFGTYRLKGRMCQGAVETALETGYRLIDTAEKYKNHKNVGKAIKNSGIPRQDIFLTSKVWRTNLRYKDVIAACHRALEELQTNYIDLYLIHWPNRKIPIKETLQALSHLKDQKLIKAIGVSNFTIHHLQDALKVGIKISASQIEFHPSLYQKTIKSFCDKNDIKIIAYSPLAQGYDLKLPLIQELSEKYQRSTAQIVLNWIISKKVTPIPRSANPKHIEDNFKSTKWKLDQKDIEKIDQLNQNHRVIHPYFNEFDY